MILDFHNRTICLKIFFCFFSRKIKVKGKKEGKMHSSKLGKQVAEKRCRPHQGRTDKYLTTVNGVNCFSSLLHEKVQGHSTENRGKRGFPGSSVLHRFWRKRSSSTQKVSKFISFLLGFSLRQSERSRHSLSSHFYETK